MWVSALLLLIIFVDTIITAFLLGKYRGLAKDYRALALSQSNHDDDTDKSLVSAVDALSGTNLTASQLAELAKYLGTDDAQ